MHIQFPQKVTERNIDQIVQDIYQNYSRHKKDHYIFDFSTVEYIGNQELLILTAILQLFYTSGIKFKINFLKAVPLSEVPERVKKQIIQIWDVWQLGKIVPNELCVDYFGISTNTVNILKQELDYYPRLSELYNRHGVTPFIHLDFINNYNESLVNERIKPIYKLSTVVEQLLEQNNCHHPFTTNWLSTIITEELFLNFLDHSGKASFEGLSQRAFMSIAFQSKLEAKNLESIKKLNFDTECIPESIEYFYDIKRKKFKNFPSIQFSFLDFGEGIASTLRHQYCQHEGLSDKSQVKDAEIIKFAFEVETSRHPIDDEVKPDRLIPRGLFDALTIVKRYKGLLTVRSNFGKVLFNFADPQHPIIKEFGESVDCYFPGTLISINLPAIENGQPIKTGPIKKEIPFKLVHPQQRKTVSFTEIVDAISHSSKEILYTKLFKKIKEKISSTEPCLTFVNFEGANQVEKRILKKTLYFFLTDHGINHDSNIVLLNFPNKDIVSEVETELNTIDRAFKENKIHPLPIIDWDYKKDKVSVDWIGVFETADKLKLNEILYSAFSIARTDLRKPNQLTGHLIDFDNFGNLVTNMMTESEISDFLNAQRNHAIGAEISRLIEKHKCICEKKNAIYLTSGNFYQKQFLELSNLVNNKNDCDLVSKLLYDSISRSISSEVRHIFIAITATSQKIVTSLISQRLIPKSAAIFLENYKHFDTDPELNSIAAGDQCILICDVISTGYLTARLDEVLTQQGATLAKVAVVANTMSGKFALTASYFERIRDKIISLYDHPIEKFLKNEVAGIINNDIIRINPFTNIPVTLSLKETRYDESVIFRTETRYNNEQNTIEIHNPFLDKIGNINIHIGFLEFNNLVHPYFFNTDAILRQAPEVEIKGIFDRIGKETLSQEPIKLFYPRRSGIESLQFNKIRSSLNNHAIEEIPMERFGTTEGWKFPHNSNHLEEIISNNICLILDDGSCSGDSLIQMIDEISFYDAKEIILVCVIGRITDHKREFFSRISSIKVNKNKSISLSVYLVSHWHIPTYYIDDNPNTKELNWLRDVISLTNTPSSIRKIAATIKDAITPKPRIKFEGKLKDYKYLPSLRDGGGVPKKDLLLVREEVGKVIGYRLYSESFQFFDAFFKKYERKKVSVDRYKEIELLCAVFIYEPYLYPRLQDVTPDIIAQVEDFVDILLFKNDAIYEMLTYKWDKKDIVHLFFIVFKDKKLFDIIADKEKFSKIVDFTSPHESALSYVLYKLLQYYPIVKEDVHEKPFADDLINIIRMMVDNDSPNKEIKKYFTFLQTLPTKESFSHQLQKLSDSYRKQKGPEYHDQKRSFNHNISEMVAAIRNAIADLSDRSPIANETIQEIRMPWFGIKDFLKPILAFASSFPGFLKPYPYYGMIEKVDGTDTSLRALFGITEDVVFRLDEKYADVEKLKMLEYNLIKIQSDFQVGTLFNKLIEEPTFEAKIFLQSLKDQLAAEGLNPEFTGTAILSELSIPIPRIYVEQLLIKELATNIREHSVNKPGISLPIQFDVRDQVLTLKIRNIAVQTRGGANGEGIKCIKLLEEFQPFGFSYTGKSVGTAYEQTLIFKLL